MKVAVRKLQVEDAAKLQMLVAENIDAIEPGLVVLDSRLLLGHATISTGALPTTHGMISNEWWDRGLGKSVTCTADPNVKNVGYAGATVIGCGAPDVLFVASVSAADGGLIRASR